MAGLLAGSFGFSGCAAVGNAVLNPYESEFSCKKVAGTGKCASTPEAYEEALAADLLSDRKDAAANPGGVGQAPMGAAESAFREAQFNKMTKLVKAPVTPIVVPPTVVRILFLPHQGEDDSLNMPQFVYTMMDKPRFILGDYLLQSAEAM